MAQNKRKEKKGRSLSSPKDRKKCLSTYSVFLEKSVVLCSFSDVDESSPKTHICSAYTKCRDTKGSYNCSCKAGYTCDGRNCTRLGKNPVVASKVGPRSFKDVDDIQQG